MYELRANQSTQTKINTSAEQAQNQNYIIHRRTAKTGPDKM